jgi:UTP--glucose-1-phosphate uridylyltransferase
VALDSDFYKLIGDFDSRFPAGAPSLRECRRLEVSGDVVFGREIAIKGEVRLEGPRSIPDGDVLEG